MKKIEKLQSVKLGNGSIQDSRNQLLRSGFCRPTNNISRNISCHSLKLQNVLKDLGIEFETGNDAPRGGKTGNFIKITDKQYLRELKSRNKEIQEAKEKAEKITVEKVKSLSDLYDSIIIDEIFENEVKSHRENSKSKDEYGKACAGSFSALLKRLNISQDLFDHSRRFWEFAIKKSNSVTM